MDDVCAMNRLERTEDLIDEVLAIKRSDENSMEVKPSSVRTWQ